MDGVKPNPKKDPRHNGPNKITNSKRDEISNQNGPHIHRIAGVDNIVANTLSCVKSSNVGEDESDSSQKRMRQELYAATKIWSIQAEFPLEKELICDEQQNELKKKKYALKTLIDDKNSGYTINIINNPQKQEAQGSLWIVLGGVRRGKHCGLPVLCVPWQV